MGMQAAPVCRQRVDLSLGELQAWLEHIWRQVEQQVRVVSQVRAERARAARAASGHPLLSECGAHRRRRPGPGPGPATATATGSACF
jgi:hypothetical protein